MRELNFHGISLLLDPSMCRSVARLTATLSLLAYATYALEEGFDKAHIAKCETDALRLGSDLSDVFNGPIGGEDWSERVHQNFITKHLGFAPWTRDGVAGAGPPPGQDATFHSTP